MTLAADERFSLTLVTDHFARHPDTRRPPRTAAIKPSGSCAFDSPVQPEPVRFIPPAPIVWLPGQRLLTVIQARARTVEEVFLPPNGYAYAIELIGTEKVD